MDRQRRRAGALRRHRVHRFQKKRHAGPGQRLHHRALPRSPTARCGSARTAAAWCACGTANSPGSPAWPATASGLSIATPRALSGSCRWRDPSSAWSQAGPRRRPSSAICPTAGSRPSPALKKAPSGSGPAPGSPPSAPAGRRCSAPATAWPAIMSIACSRTAAAVSGSGRRRASAASTPPGSAVSPLADGLADNMVRAIGEDATGRIWIGGDKGVTIMDAGREGPVRRPGRPGRRRGHGDLPRPGGRHVGRLGGRRAEPAASQRGPCLRHERRAWPASSSARSPKTHVGPHLGRYPRPGAELAGAGQWHSVSRRDGLASNAITALLPVRDERMWIGTLDAGLQVMAGGMRFRPAPPGGPADGGHPLPAQRGRSGSLGRLQRQRALRAEQRGMAAPRGGQRPAGDGHHGAGRGPHQQHDAVGRELRRGALFLFPANSLRARPRRTAWPEKRSTPSPARRTASGWVRTPGLPC